MRAEELTPYVRRNLGQAAFVVERFATALVDDHFDARFEIGAARGAAVRALQTLAELTQVQLESCEVPSRVNLLGAVDLVLDVVGWLASYRDAATLTMELAVVTDFCNAAQKLWAIGQTEVSYPRLQRRVS